MSNLYSFVMVSKLSGAYYAVRSMYHISFINTLKSIYFAYFHSIIKYVINFWGNSYNSKKIFALQKKNNQNYGRCTTKNSMHKYGRCTTKNSIQKSV
jgi:hypothetical protein